MTAAKMSLKEMLEHLFELSENGLVNDQVFEDAQNEFLRQMQTADQLQKKSAIDFLKSKDVQRKGIGNWNLDYYIEELEG